MNFKDTLKINSKNHLEIGGVDTVELVNKYSTPLYVMTNLISEAFVEHTKKQSQKNMDMATVHMHQRLFLALQFTR